MVLEVAEYLRARLDIRRLDSDLRRQSSVDIEDLRWAVEELAAATSSTPDEEMRVRFADGTEYPWKDRLETLHALVDTLVDAHTLEEVEVGLRLQVVGDAAIAGLLVAIPEPAAVHERFRNRVRRKLAFLPDQEAVDFWARLRAEVDPSIEDHFEVDTAVVETAFFDFAKSADDARDRIARYLSVVRPALKRKAIERGQLRFLVAGVGVATIFSWTDAPSARPLSVTDRIAVHALGRVCHAWDGERDELARALDVPIEGFFVGGRAEEEAKRVIKGYREKGDAPAPDRIFDELTKLVRIAAARAPSIESPIERALTAHKLGLEVVAPDIRQELLALNELGLQRRLCRFLFERDIRAFGTKVGWSELDVRAENGMTSLLIETKKETSGISIAKIKRWLTQLGSYMDQEHRAVRGALVIYNFTPVPIFAPKTTILHRYFVVPINLCPMAPSGRGASVELVEGALSEPVRLVPLGRAQGAMAPPSRSAKRATKSERPSKAGGKRRARKSRQRKDST